MVRRWARLRLPHGDSGSVLPMILLCFLIVAFLIMGVTAASSAFLAQADLYADCDSAAAAAASVVSQDAVRSGALQHSDVLPLDAELVQSAVDEYRERYFTPGDTIEMRVQVTNNQLALACRRHVTVPFGRVFNRGDGIERTVVSQIHSPVRDSDPTQ